jgi:hypothetical protein
MGILLCYGAMERYTVYSGRQYESLGEFAAFIFRTEARNPYGSIISVD